jgi:tetratricopeptide (TPR) repeat protein
LILAGALISAPLAQAQQASGAYLAGRQAMIESDFAAAAEYYTRALVRDTRNPLLLENAIFAQLALGRLDRAQPMAQQMAALGIASQVGHLALAAGWAKAGDYETILQRDAQSEGISQLVDGLLTAWAHMGDGSVSKALEAFDRLAEVEGLRGFAMYHRALALASVGDFEGADAIFASDGGKLALISRRAVIARAEVLSQLGRNEEALGLLDDAFGGRTDPGLSDLRDRLKAGGALPFSVAGGVTGGFAEIFYSVGAALSGEAADDYVLIYTRLASALSDAHVDAVLLSADLLDQLGQYELSVATYKQVPQGHPEYHAAELGRAEALRRAAKPDAAIEVLEQLARSYPDLPDVYSALGDLLRQEEQYGAAADAFDTALALTPEDAPGRWYLLYSRGISHERLKEWDQAEADFRGALALNPEQPSVLNYLGYSLVEKQIKLDEALEMIERAAASRPDSGYIVDSLGWVLYRLGRYSEAVSHLEKAVELMPVDPVVNDHLGDVFWAVGRRLEAEFQWKRALSFIDPDDTGGEADPERIRRKLEVGLDQVLQEEGAAPLEVANEG